MHLCCYLVLLFAPPLQAGRGEEAVCSAGSEQGGARTPVADSFHFLFCTHDLGPSRPQMRSSGLGTPPASSPIPEGDESGRIQTVDPSSLLPWMSPHPATTSIQLAAADDGQLTGTTGGEAKMGRAAGEIPPPCAAASPRPLWSSRPPGGARLPALRRRWQVEVGT